MQHVPCPKEGNTTASLSLFGFVFQTCLVCDNRLDIYNHKVDTVPKIGDSYVAEYLLSNETS